eukprot:8494063-Pyramimonas_sp.AAC.1
MTPRVVKHRTRSVRITRPFRPVHSHKSLTRTSSSIERSAPGTLFVYSHNGPIGRRKLGYIHIMDQSQGGSGLGLGTPRPAES